MAAITLQIPRYPTTDDFFDTTYSDCISLYGDIVTSRIELDKAKTNRNRYNTRDTASVWTAEDKKVKHYTAKIEILEKAYKTECLKSDTIDCNSGFANASVTFPGLRDTISATVEKSLAEFDCDFVVENEIFFSTIENCKIYKNSVLYNNGIISQMNTIESRLDSILNTLKNVQNTHNDFIKNFESDEERQKILDIKNEIKNYVLDLASNNAGADSHRININNKFQALQDSFKNHSISILEQLAAVTEYSQTSISSFIGLSEDKTLADFIEDNTLPFKTIEANFKLPYSSDIQDLLKEQKKWNTTTSTKATKSLGRVTRIKNDRNGIPKFGKDVFDYIVRRYDVSDNTILESGFDGFDNLVFSLALSETIKNLNNLEAHVKRLKSTLADRKLEIANQSIALQQNLIGYETNVQEDILTFIEQKITQALSNMPISVNLQQFQGIAQLNNSVETITVDSFRQKDFNTFIKTIFLTDGGVKFVPNPNLTKADVEDFFDKTFINTAPDISTPLAERPDGITYGVNMQAQFDLETNLLTLIEALGYDIFKVVRDDLAGVFTAGLGVPVVPDTEEEFQQLVNNSSSSYRNTKIKEDAYLFFCVPILKEE